jgi:hypothetical protein
MYEPYVILENVPDKKLKFTYLLMENHGPASRIVAGFRSKTFAESICKDLNAPYQLAILKGRIETKRKRMEILGR